MPIHLFSEYEAFAEAIGEASVTMRLTALEEPAWSLQHATAGALRLQHGFEGGGSIAEGATFHDGWVFYHQQFQGITNGQVATEDHVFAAPPGSEFCLVCHPMHEWHSIFVPTQLLFSSPEELEFAYSARPQLLKPPPAVTARFVSLASRFLKATESQPRLENSSAAVDMFQSELLWAIKELFVRNTNPDRGHLVRWRNRTRSAMELVSHRSDKSLSIAELARQLGTPERSLRTAFYQYYGLSPREYLRVRRLNEARLRLLASDPDEITVTQIALDLGFWDVGRFAGAYRRLYGELPSATLRKSVRRSSRIS